jgi:hypothetical protein
MAFEFVTKCVCDRCGTELDVEGNSDGIPPPGWATMTLRREGEEWAEVKTTPPSRLLCEVCLVRLGSWLETTL